MQIQHRNFCSLQGRSHPFVSVPQFPSPRLLILSPVAAAVAVAAALLVLFFLLLLLASVAVDVCDYIDLEVIDSTANTIHSTF